MAIDLRDQTFGVEIETVGMQREQAAKLVAAMFGTEAYYEGSVYQTWTCKDKQGRKWKFMRDASLNTVNGVCDGCEIVTPVLNYKDIETLQQVVRVVRLVGANADGSCGIHVHVGADKHTPQSMTNLMKMFIGKEDTIYKGLQVSERRTCSYTQKVNRELARRLGDGEKPRTFEDWKRLWYSAHGEMTSAANNHYDHSRYHGLNYHAFFNRGATVEFRLFNGSLHAGKIKAYVQFCLALSAKAINSRTVSMQKVDSTDEKHMYGCWLLRLGLEGDEFATCREHIMAGLQDAATGRRAA